MQFVTLAFVTLCSLVSGSDSNTTYIPPQDQYPDYPVPADRTAGGYGRHKFFNPSRGKSEEYWATRQTDNCVYPLEVLILQDMTDSFSDDIDQMVNVQLDAMMTALNSAHPGSVVNVVSFRDKPVKPYGEDGSDGIERDYCWRLEGSGFTNNVTVLKNEYKGMDASGGGDFPEGNYFAIFGAMQSDNIGWNGVPNAQQLIVMTTDAAPHYDGDGNSRGTMEPFSGAFDVADPEGQCVREFYPTADQAVGVTMHPVVGGTDLPFLAFLIYDGDYPRPNYTTDAWNWYSDAIGEPHAHWVNDLNADSSDFWPQLAQIIQTMDQANCVGTTTTTVPTTTTEPTTTTSVDHTTVTTTPTTTTPTTTTTPETTTIPETTTTRHLRTTRKCRPCPRPCPMPCPCVDDDDIRIVARVPSDIQEAILDVKF